jgi:cGMP-dependent protein kinase
MKTFKDTLDVYFLLEYVRGMELFDVIRDIGIL